MAACRYRVSKLRSEIESERKRQGLLCRSFGRKVDVFEGCKQSTASTSVIKVVANNSTVQNCRAAGTTTDPSPCWSTLYELNRGDWDSPVQVHVYRLQKSPKPTKSLRHLVAAKRIARWFKQILCMRQAAPSPPPPIPTTTERTRINPDDLLARIAQQINDQANLQRQNRAGHVIQRFFTYVLDRRSASMGQQHRHHRILIRQQLRRRQAQELDAMERAVRLIQATYRGSSSRRRFTWKQSTVKGHFIHILILEAEWTAQPGRADVLRQLAAAYWTYYDEHHAVYDPLQRSLMLRMHLLCAMKAITYGYDPSSAENDDAAKWWMAIGRRFLLLWEHTTDEPALLQEALTAFSNAQRTISDDAIDPEVLCDEVHVQFALGLYCHVIKKCQHVAFELWGNLDRMTQVWLWEGQAHFHVGDYHEAALRFQSIMTRSVPSTPLMPYTNVELWVILGRCAVLCNNLDRAQLYYDKILCSMYGDDDIVRRGLSWEHVMNDATLHLTCGSKCAKRRDFPLAVDLLRYGKQLNPNVTTVHHDEVLAECIRHTVHLDTRASRATWEAQKRIPLTRLRERLGVVL